ncbi:hypothetical protein EIP86_006652 [Pleurotus ostreatoroseus]|nr:hypothetical protein EIP86_006652 [Pleurotus ostreatoroseus]
MRRQYPPKQHFELQATSATTTSKSTKTASRSKASNSKSTAQPTAFSRSKLSPEDVDRVASLMQAKYGWESRPREFQINGVIAQLEGVDMVIQAPTRSGKTAVIAGPHVWPACQGMVTIVSVPIIALGEEMVQTFATNFGLKVVAINSKNGALSLKVREDILAGRYSIVIASPEMLQSQSFVKHILRNTAFSRKILSIVVDEAHYVSHWGASFRKKYGQLGTIRAYPPPRTPVITLTATLTARVR